MGLQECGFRTMSCSFHERVAEGAEAIPLQDDAAAVWKTIVLTCLRSSCGRYGGRRAKQAKNLKQRKVDDCLTSPALEQQQLPRDNAVSQKHEHHEFQYGFKA